MFDWIAKGELEVRIGGTYPLADAARAQEDLASRRTTGKLLLLPGTLAAAIARIRGRHHGSLGLKRIFAFHITLVADD